MKITLHCENDLNNCIIMSSAIANNIGLGSTRETFVRFGFSVTEAEIIVDDSLNDEEIMITKDITDKLKLPLFCSYELNYRNYELNFGPFIGIILSTSEEGIQRNFSEINKYIKHYKETRGTIVVFSLEGVNKKNLCAEAYIFNPKKNIWIKEKVPFPSMIFKVISLSKNWTNYFFSLYGGKLVNFKAIDKWAMHRMLSQFECIKQYLPSTEKLTSPENLVKFLHTHGDIYLKPLDGKKGEGIYNIKKNNNKIYIYSREAGENRSIILDSYSQLEEFVRDISVDINYIIQETLDIKIGENLIDFRISLDKGADHEWKNFIFIGKVGQSESIVSNRSSGGHIATPDQILKNHYKMSESNIAKYKEEMLRVAIDSVKCLDRIGYHYAKCGVDLALDNKGNIYLIELNTRRPNDGLGSYVGDEKASENITLTNMLYLKKMSGFNEYKPSIYEPEPSISDSNLIKRYKIIVSGKVQGVAFRKHIKQIAVEAGLTGWVRNLKTGVVEISVQGKEILLNDFVSKIKNGPKNIEVKNIGLKYSSRQNSSKFIIKKNEPKS